MVRRANQQNNQNNQNQPNSFNVLGEEARSEAEQEERMNTQSFSHNENPGIALVSSLLTGSNFLSWSKAIKRSLIAKDKLQFITDHTKPDEGTVEYKRWLKSDCLVSSWILNSMDKDLSDDFLFVETARELWIELEHRFGQSNGPLLYQLKKNVSLLTQNEMSVMQYFAKLKRFWSELAQMLPDPTCVCGCACNAFNIIAERKQNDQLMQFLMGLNGDFDGAVNQILLMDPLPIINRAYSMITKVEMQKEVTIVNSIEVANYSKKRTYSGSTRGNYSGFRSNNKESGEERPCTHCKSPYHSKSTCFQLT